MKLELRNIRLPLRHFMLEADVELTANRTGIFGPSGAGKTSLLEIIAGLRRPQSALISLDGVAFENTAEKNSLPVRERRIGYVSQDVLLFPHLSVRRNLLYGCRRAATKSSPPLLEVAEFLGIERLLESDVRALSRGEQQRVAIARALLSGPRLLLLDEPLTALDAELKEHILARLQALPDEFGVPFLFVSHEVAEVRATCDEVLLVRDGQITARGTADELLPAPASTAAPSRASTD